MSYGISGEIFGLIFSFVNNILLQVVLDGKSSREYPVSAGVPQGSMPGPTLFLLYINELLTMLPVILLSILRILLSTLNVFWDLICGTN